MSGRTRSIFLFELGGAVFMVVVGSALHFLFFTTYVTILGHNLLALDIGTFIAAILIGQLLSAVLLTQAVSRRGVILPAGFGLLALQILAYSLFTFLPPDHWLFIEASSGMRGIPAF